MQPLRRVGAKGSGQFEPVSWDDALDIVATQLQAAIAQYGPETVWPNHYAVWATSSAAPSVVSDTWPAGRASAKPSALPCPIPAGWPVSASSVASMPAKSCNRT